MQDRVLQGELWERLERPERLKDLNPEQTLISLGLRLGEKFADFGSGTGIFVIPALKIVGPSGKVYAIEKSQELIDRMFLKLQDKPGHLVVKQQDLMDLDWNSEPVHRAMLCHVAHELSDLKGFLQQARQAILPGGKMSIIEWCAKDQPVGPPLHRRVPQEVLFGLLETSGWSIESSHLLGDDFYAITALPPSQ
jgi:ubiquinone/menaquinone biosynthesis C-methylase UbiE